jgi:K+/H+ antiporter YhaU regulatory subunit KhtT
MESRLRDDYGAYIIGIKKPNQKMTIAPGPQTTLGETDILVLIGPTGDLERLTEELNRKA